ncbi:MAG: sugar ABC transporter permease [Lachnospiraceae bacterium]|nr:sugar ABC transporter permease [Lachnospiraceae bacterium]
MKRKKHQNKLTKIDKKDMKTAYIMLFPAIIMLTIFVIVPLVMALQKSFYDWNFYIDSVFVGFDNYRIIINTVYFQKAVANIIKFVVIIVPLMIIVSFLFANVLVNLSKKLSAAIRTMIYIPGIVSGIATSVIFIFVLDYKGGIVNQILMKLGSPRVAFLNDPFWATIAIIIPTIWLGLGGNTILMYAGLMNIPNEYYEAASVDGAGGLKKMIHITIPQLKNIFVLMCISLTAGTLQMFDIPYMLTGGGPSNSTLTPMLYLYNNYRDTSKGMGYTIAGAVLMLILITAINSIVFAVIKSDKSIEG